MEVEKKVTRDKSPEDTGDLPATMGSHLEACQQPHHLWLLSKKLPIEAMHHLKYAKKDLGTQTEYSIYILQGSI